MITISCVKYCAFMTFKTVLCLIIFKQCLLINFGERVFAVKATHYDRKYAMRKWFIFTLAVIFSCWLLPLESNSNYFLLLRPNEKAKVLLLTIILVEPDGSCFRRLFPIILQANHHFYAAHMCWQWNAHIAVLLTTPLILV